MDQRKVAVQLLRRLGRTFASEAGITLRDEPAPLWQLVVMSQLLSTRISSDVAIQTARELWSAGWRTPQKLRSSTWGYALAFPAAMVVVAGVLTTIWMVVTHICRRRKNSSMPRNQ